MWCVRVRVCVCVCVCVREKKKCVLREKCVREENMRVQVCVSVYLAAVFRTTRKLTMSINGLVSSCRAIAQFVYVSGCEFAKGLFSGSIGLSCRYTGHVCGHIGFCC